jgi:uncharacterized membrane protein (UPF0182 family)
MPSTEDRVDFGAAGNVSLQQVDSTTDYLNMDELDEESISWNILITRIVCIVLFLIVIACSVGGALKNQKLYILAAIVAIIALMVFMCSFSNSESLRSVYVWRGTISRNDASPRSTVSALHDNHRAGHSNL